MKNIQKCEYCEKECDAETINNTSAYGFLCDDCLGELSSK